MTPGNPHNRTHPSNLDGENGPHAMTEDAPPDLSFLSPPTEPGDLGWLGSYRVRRLLGVGGVWSVFLELDTHLLRPVALKVLRPELASSLSSRTRFLKEARAAAALSSDHIVTVFQVGQNNDVPYIAMQLLFGEPLDARLAREGRLSVHDALNVAIQAATGLSAAHAAGLIHRDIKPANLWLEAARSAELSAMLHQEEMQNEDTTIMDLESARSAERGMRSTFGRVKILDLGLVRGGSGPQLTAAGMVVGTPQFMAPEQAGGEEMDHRVDLFSLGCVIYTMLSGQVAFTGATTMAILLALATKTPSPLVELNPAVPKELSDLVARMMAKEPKNRPGSAIEVIEQLEAIRAAYSEQVPPGTGFSRRGSGPQGRATPREPLPATEVVPVSALAATPPVSSLPTPSLTPVPVPLSAPPTEPPAWSRRQVIGVVAGLFALSSAVVIFGLLISGKRGENPTPPDTPPVAGAQEP